MSNETGELLSAKELVQRFGYGVQELLRRGLVEPVLVCTDGKPEPSDLHYVLKPAQEAQAMEPQGAYAAREEIGYRPDEPPANRMRIDLSPDFDIDKVAEQIRESLSKALDEAGKQILESSKHPLEAIEPDEPQDLTRLVAHMKILQSAGMKRKDLANHGYEYALAMFRADCEEDLRQGDELTPAQQKQIMDISAYWLSQAMHQLKRKSK